MPLTRAAASMRLCSFIVSSPAPGPASMPRHNGRFHRFLGMFGQGAKSRRRRYRPPDAPSASPAIAAKAEKKKRGEERAHGLAREGGAGAEECVAANGHARLIDDDGRDGKRRPATRCGLPQRQTNASLAKLPTEETTCTSIFSCRPTDRTSPRAASPTV